MWMCRAVLADGTVCETTNFDTAASCSNCGAPRQANEGGIVDHDAELAEKFITGAKSVASLGREKAKQYAPVAAAMAVEAKARAGSFAMHSRLATQTGVHPASVLSFAIILLIVSIALPVTLNWPLKLSITQRDDLRASNSGYELEQEISGSLS